MNKARQLLNLLETRYDVEFDVELGYDNKLGWYIEYRKERHNINNLMPHEWNGDKDGEEATVKFNATLSGGSRPTPPSMDYPGDPGEGPEVEFEDAVLAINGDEAIDISHEIGSWGKLTSDLESKAIENKDDYHDREREYEREDEE